MRKLKLDVENVTVESFTLESVPQARGGTVQAHNHTQGGHRTCQFSCAIGCTYDMSCYEPCATTGTGIV